jgi:predicted dehydrogenase
VTEQNQRVIRWGILGLGGISNSFTSELVNTPGAKVWAVAARSKEKAEQFATKFSVSRAYGSYKELTHDPEIDIVYIGTIHPAHRDNVMDCLRGGKSVLCEKPFTMNADEAREIADYARERGLFVMEAMWTRFLPAIVQVRKWLADGRVGEVKLLKAEFGFDAGWNPEGRLLNKELGGGTLLDAGIYPVSLASMVFGMQPSRIVSSAHIGETGVDEQYSVIFEYEGGAMAALQGSVRLQMNNDAWLYGTKGKIYIPEFLAAKKATLYPNDGEPETFKDDRTLGGQNFQALEAMRCLLMGKTGSSVMPIDETVDIMGTMDAIRAQWNLMYNVK